VPFNRNPHFPLNSVMIMRALVGAQRDGAFGEQLAHAYNARWVEGRKLDDPTVIETVAEASGVGVGALARWVGDESVKAVLRRNTDSAAARGAFGAPTFFVGDEMVFGQDRLDGVEAAALAA